MALFNITALKINTPINAVTISTLTSSYCSPQSIATVDNIAYHNGGNRELLVGDILYRDTALTILYNQTGTNRTYNTNDTALGYIELTASSQVRVPICVGVSEYDLERTGVNNTSNNLFDLTLLENNSPKDTLQLVQPTGFEALNEGNGIGWRLLGRNAANFGNIGGEAIDASSYFGDAVGIIGATGFASAAFGEDNLSSGYSAFTAGYLNIASGDASTALGSSLNIAGTGSFGAGIQNSTTNHYSSAIGRGNSVTNWYSHAHGTALNVSVTGAVALGRGNTPMTADASLNPAASRTIFVVGNGTLTAGANVVPTVASDAFLIKMGGDVIAPSLTTTLIDAEATGRVLITKEWITSQNFGGGNIDTITGTIVDSTDPRNPIINTPNLQQVTDVGNTTSNSMIVDGDLTIGNKLYVKNQADPTNPMAIFQSSSTVYNYILGTDPSGNVWSVGDAWLADNTVALSAHKTGANIALNIGTNRRLLVNNNGSIQINAYGSNSISGTPAYALAVDSTGNIIETALNSGGSDQDLQSVTDIGSITTNAINVASMTTNGTWDGDSYDYLIQNLTGKTIAANQYLNVFNSWGNTVTTPAGPQIFSLTFQVETKAVSTGQSDGSGAPIMYLREAAAHNVFLVGRNAASGAASQINSKLQVGFSQDLPNHSNTNILDVNGAARIRGTVASDATIANINTLGNTALTTKEYGDTYYLGVETVTGTAVDNTDPRNPIVNLGGGGSPLTTKGDIYTFSTVNTRLPIGTNGLFLRANSSTSTGLEWGEYEGYWEYGTRATGGDDIIVVLGDHDNTGNGTSLTVDDYLGDGSISAYSDGIYLNSNVAGLILSPTSNGVIGGAKLFTSTGQAIIDLLDISGTINITAPGDLNVTGNIVLGTSNTLSFSNSGFEGVFNMATLSSNVSWLLRATSGTVAFTQDFSPVVAPTSATSTGVTGQMYADANYFYRCIDTNTWVRVAMATW